MRIFIAIDIDEMKTLSNIERIKHTIQSLNVPIKLVENENLHITLLFIGEISEYQVESLKHHLSKIVFKPIKIKLKGMGAFPSLSRPRVVWIGVEGEIQPLQKLQQYVEIYTKEAGINFQSTKGFIPHLTIGRIKGQRNIAALAKLITSLQDMEFGEQLITSLKIKQSILTPKGPIYKDIFVIKAEER